jgi:phytoene synthase
LNQHSYLADRAPAPGSSAYYALRLAPRREQVLALYVLLRELSSIVEMSEDSVALAKLAWWRQELTSLLPGEGRAAPSHPLTQVLAELGYNSEPCVLGLLQIAQAIETDLTQSRFLDQSALDQNLSCAAGAPAQSLALALGAKPASVQAVCELGMAIGRARLLMDTGRYARQKRIYLPHQLLKQFDVPAADILKAAATPALTRLGAAEAAVIRLQVKAALAKFTKQDKRQLRALVVYAALTLARLDEVARDGFRITLHRVSLTPLRKLLIAWRSAFFPS